MCANSGLQPKFAEARLARMSYALIDNASLTAVQRVLGDIVVKNRDTVSGDLVAFENLIQAILFYDDLVCIDNYKEEYAQERRANFDFMQLLEPVKLSLETVESKARDEARALHP